METWLLSFNYCIDLITNVCIIVCVYNDVVKYVLFI